MVILMTEDTTDAQYKDLTSSIPNPANHKEIFYEIVNFRVLIAEIDDCDIKKLWDNPIVEAMSLNGPLILDDEADDTSAATTKRETFEVPPHNFERVTRNTSDDAAGLTGRALDDLIDLYTQTNSPWHLKMLSGLSYSVGTRLNGLYYDFRDYLFADRSTTAAGVSEVTIYVLDTGLRDSHNVILHALHPKAALIGSHRTSLGDM